MRRSRTARAQPATAEGSFGGATQGRWRARPGLARALRCAAFVAPIAISVSGVYLASRFVPPPRGSFVLFAGWWAALSLGASVVLAVAGRLTRRLLPLAALMRLSLVFPDGAPSRFRIAMRSGTVTTLEERLADARDGSAARTPLEAAQLLLELVAHLDTHDALTRGHSERVRAYAQSIGNELGLSRKELDLLNWAALLHDVGKLEVPRAILTKDGRPTDDEWKLLRRHPLAGGELTAPLRGWLGDWARAIEDHHERWDGAGYPRGLARTEISRGGRIVAVADVYDVITSSRTYKRAGTAESARRELSACAGSQFDPAIVRAFLAISVRPRFGVTGPLAWLGHASVLARVPLASTAGAVSASALTLAVAAAVPQAGVSASASASAPTGAPEDTAATHVAAPSTSRAATAVSVARSTTKRRTPSAVGPGGEQAGDPEGADETAETTETMGDGGRPDAPGSPDAPTATDARPEPTATPTAAGDTPAAPGTTDRLRKLTEPVVPTVDRSVKDLDDVVQDVGEAVTTVGDDVAKDVGETVGQVTEDVDDTVAEVVSSVPATPSLPPVPPPATPTVPLVPSVPPPPPVPPIQLP